MTITLQHQAWLSVSEWIELYEYLTLAAQGPQPHGLVFHYEQATDPTLDPSNDVRDGQWWADTSSTTLNRYDAASGEWVAWLGPGGGGGGGEFPEGSYTDPLGNAYTNPALEAYTNA